MQTHYQILGIPESATPEQIRQAFKRLAVQYHPDKNPNNPQAEEVFKQVNAAYQVLSDPEQKSRYDLQLLYRRTATRPPRPAQAPSTSPKPKRPKPRPPYPFGFPYTRNPEREKEGNKWALGTLLVIALVVIAQVNIKNYLEARDMEASLALRDTLFQQSKSFYEVGNYDSTLFYLDSLTSLRKYDTMVNRFKESVFQELNFRAEYYFKEGDCAQALPYFRLIRTYQADANSIVLYKMSLCFKNLGKTDEALSSLFKLEKQEPSSVLVQNEIALLYTDYVGDYTEALSHYEKAADLIVQEYTDFYGKAYALVVDPTKTPEAHYDTHYGLAICYTKAKKYKEALNACTWAIFLRPNYAKTYEIEGLGYFESQNLTEACASWKKAEDLASETAANWRKQYCQ
ncbi:DnaJ domain-containing protein [Cytophagales bacterium LB-30]|uniref:DnaJ domain-containing protein n=1 Tax=Shiella aurantiaca TaxID=3058365 RepID=A0ABT8F4P2_9BACT|nr:DnaJ domain-containing protein [Shiella aurantiaca]MDN4165191.1 DnaJ domain-containing protein [Shiella aurantiaca]